MQMNGIFIFSRIKWTFTMTEYSIAAMLSTLQKYPRTRLLMILVGEDVKICLIPSWHHWSFVIIQDGRQHIVMLWKLVNWLRLGKNRLCDTPIQLVWKISSSLLKNVARAQRVIMLAGGCDVIRLGKNRICNTPIQLVWKNSSSLL